MEILFNQLVDEGGGGDFHPSIPLQHILQISNIALNAQNLVAFGCKKKYISLKQTNEQKCSLPGGSYSGPPYWHGFNFASKYATLRGITIWKNRIVKIGKTTQLYKTVQLIYNIFFQRTSNLGGKEDTEFAIQWYCNRSFRATSLQPIACKQTADWLQSLFVQFPPRIHVIGVLQGSQARGSQICKEPLTQQTCWIFLQKVGLSMR